MVEIYYKRKEYTNDETAIALAAVCQSLKYTLGLKSRQHTFVSNISFLDCLILPLVIYARG